jgi:putative acetyltransferase
MIRPEARADRDAIRRVVTDAFGSEAEADLVEAIRNSPEYIADMALVAEVAGAIVGHVMISGATIRTDQGDRRIVMLSPLAVIPEHQRAGIGGELVRTVTGIAEAAGEPFVVLEGNPAYYWRFGFEFAGALGVDVPLPDWAPPEAGQMLRFDNDDPALRGTVIYPPAFDSVE